MTKTFQPARPIWCAGCGDFAVQGVLEKSFNGEEYSVIPFGKVPLSNLPPESSKISILLVIAVLLNSACALLVGAAAGGAGVYYLKDKGYKVQTPVTKE